MSERPAAGAWRRHTGAKPTLHARLRLYRLGSLTDERDREQLVYWYGEFAAAVGHAGAADPGTWADSRIADGR